MRSLVSLRNARVNGTRGVRNTRLSAVEKKMQYAHSARTQCFGLT